MKKFELIVKNRRTVLLHKIFEFTESEYQEFIIGLVKGETDGYNIRGELEDVIMKTRGRKYYEEKYCDDEYSEYFENPLSVFKRPLQHFVDTEPDMLIAAGIQSLCYSFFPQDEFLNINCENTKTVVDRIMDIEFRCKIIE